MARQVPCHRFVFILAFHRLQQHPDKTFIGRVSHGFDFLGYAFSAEGLGLAEPTIARFAEHVTRLYEQGAPLERIGDYVRHWLKWVNAGLAQSGSEQGGKPEDQVKPSRQANSMLGDVRNVGFLYKTSDFFTKVRGLTGVVGLA